MKINSPINQNIQSIELSQPKNKEEIKENRVLGGKIIQNINNNLSKKYALN